MDAKGFIREVYLKSVPSVDLEKVTEKVDCCEHKLSVKEYEKILERFCETENEKFQANMWLVCSGPQLVND